MFHLIRVNKPAAPVRIVPTLFANHQTLQKRVPLNWHLKSFDTVKWNQVCVCLLISPYLSMEACWSDLRRASAAVPLSLPARRIGGRWTPVLPPAPPGCSPSDGTNRRAAGAPSKGWSRTRPPSPRKSPPAASASPADSCHRACTHLSEVSSACKKAWFLPRPTSPHNIQNSADDQVISLLSLSLWLAHRHMLRIHREGKLRRCWRRSGRVARRAPSLFLTASKLFSFFPMERGDCCCCCSIDWRQIS